MLLLKNITYSKMLYSTMGRYFSINTSGQLSRLYKYCMCIIYPMQLSFNTFDVWRRKKQLIAYCNWQIGQVTNLLNYLFDSSLKRIYLTQAGLAGVLCPNIAYTYNPDYLVDSLAVFVPDIISQSTIFAPSIDDTYIAISQVFVNIPTAIVKTSESEIKSTIEQIKLTGLTYVINSI